ncbi:MAG: GNAT family N-acetyltransferase [Myxococcota bacterium]
MVRWFTAWLERLVRLGIDLAAALVGGILSAPLRGAQRAASRGTVRRGTAEEVVDVRHAVLRAGKGRETAIFAGDDAPDTRHWVVDHDGRVIGAVSVMAAPMPDGGEARWQLRGMGVLAEHRGLGLGEALLQATHRDVAAPMWCNARTGVVPFYARAGWTPLGAPFEVAGIGPHQRMVWRPRAGYGPTEDPTP